MATKYIKKENKMAYFIDTNIKDILKNEPVDTEVTLRGWLRSLRKSKKFSFIVLNDGSCQASLQIIADATLENYEEISSMRTGFCVEIHGKIVASGGRQGGIEMQAQKVTVLGDAPEDYPLQKKATSLEFLRDIAHLRPRSNTFGAVFRIRNRLNFATHEFFNKQNFIQLHSPIITGADAEGAGEMFQVSTLNLDNPPRNQKNEIDFEKDYFGHSSNLTVSGQLNAEAFALSLGKVYTFGPTFRAENSNTPRHLAEFWMVEPEVAFADLEDIANLATDYLKFMINEALTHCKDDLEFLQSRYKEDLLDNLKQVAESDFKKITYTEAIETLSKSNKKFEFKTDWGSDLQTEHERYITEEHFKGPVIVTDYPKIIKPFYMKQNDDDKTVRAMDILVPGVGELMGGSQREDSLEKLTTRMEDMKMEFEELNWYLDLRKYGTAVHSGFGLGFERAVMYITGMSNVRDVIPFPRTPNNCRF